MPSATAPCRTPRSSATARTSGHGRCGSSWPATSIRSAPSYADEPKGRQLLDAAGLDDSRLPVVITEKGETLVEPIGRRTGHYARSVHHPATRNVRPCGDRRRPRGPGCGGVRRLGGSQDGAHREGHHRRAGGPQFEDRELPGLPHRRLGCRAHHLGTPAGRTLRRRGHHDPRGGQARDQRRRSGALDPARRGSTIGARAVILATGVDYRQLQITGCWDDPDGPECNYIGRGVYYGASVSDNNECAGEDVYIVGGANSAGQAAMYMSQTAKSVTMLVRGASLEAACRSI